MNGNAQSLVKTVTQEIATYGEAIILNAELSAVATIELIGMLQLCTRHPALPDRQKEFAKEMVGNLSRAFKPEHRAIAELIKRGWSQEHDQEVSA